MSESTSSELNEEYLEKKLPDSPISNIKELQYWYGVIEASKRGYKSNHGIHLEEFGNAGSEDSLLYCDFIRNADGLEFDGVTLRQYRENDLEQHESVMYIKYSASRGKEHSITQKSKKNPSKDKVISKVNNMLDWVFEEAIQDFIEESEDVGLLEELEDISNDDSVRDSILDAVDKELSDDPSECLITIRVREDGVWKRPGEYQQLIDSAIERRLVKNSKKTSFELPSTGKGRTFIKNENSKLVGTPEDSLGSFKSKQQSTFTNLINDESSWMSNPVSFDESLHISLSENMIDDLYENVFNFRIYFLPYIEGVPTVKKSKIMYKIIDQMTSEYINIGDLDHNPASDLISGMVKADVSDKFNFYTIGLRNRSAMKEIMFTIPRLKKPYVIKLAEDYAEKVRDLEDSDSSLISGVRKEKEKVQNQLKDGDGRPSMYDLALNKDGGFSWNIPLYASVFSGGWIKEAFGSIDDFSDNDPRSTLYQKTLERSKFSRSILFEKLLEQILSYESQKQSEGSSVVSSRMIVHQLGMVSSLQENNIVDVPGHIGERNKNPPTYMSNMTDITEDIEKALNELPDGTAQEHKYAFCVGSAIGRISAYQESARDMSKTIVHDHPISRMNPKRLRESVKDFADKASVYDLYGYTGQIEMIRQIQPSFENLDNVRTTDIQYFYALGIAHGRNQYFRTDDDE